MKVSLVMAVYNGERYLKETIDSILAQTYHDIEIIIVNDGSTDKTNCILEGIQDERVRILKMEQNKGVANALNIGILQAKGDWIAIHDSDDISMPNRIEEQVLYINDHPSLIAVGSFIECFSSENVNPSAFQAMKNLEKYKNSIITYDQIKVELFKGCPLTHGSLLYTKEAFFKAGQYDTKYKIASDYDFFMRLAKIGPIENVTKVLYKYRKSQESLSNSNVQLTSNEFLSASTRYIKMYCFHPMKENPNIFVFGSKKGSLAFKKIMQEEKILNVLGSMSEFNYEKLSKAYLDYKKGMIDAFIILSNTAKEELIIRFLKEKGLEQNKKIFTLWSAI